MRHRIVYIDSATGSKEAFSKCFSSNYHVHAFDDPEQCVRFVKQNSVSVLIARYNLRNTTGIDFLRRLAYEAPDTHRILALNGVDPRSAYEPPADKTYLVICVKTFVENLQQIYTMVGQLVPFQFNNLVLLI